MSAHDQTPDAKKQSYEQPPPFDRRECGCAHETVTIVQSNRLAVSLATFATCLAMFTLAVACFGWFTPESETRYVPYPVQTWAPENPPMSEPVDSTTAKEKKAYAKSLAEGAADIKKWRVEQQLQKASDANVAQLYLCDAKSSTGAGRYVAASMIDRRGDQDWDIVNGERLGNPRATALEWCASVPEWAQPTPPNIEVPTDTPTVKPPNIGDPGGPDVP